jgi:hypothetical protein
VGCPGGRGLAKGQRVQDQDGGDGLGPSEGQEDLDQSGPSAGGPGGPSLSSLNRG